MRSLDPARKAGRNNPSDFELAGTARYHLVPRAKWPSRSPRETQRDPCATPIVGVRPPRHVEVRLSDLPRRDPAAMAIVARAQPHVDPRRVVVLLEHRHRPTKVPLPRSRRRSDLLRVDRFDRHPPQAPAPADQGAPTPKSSKKRSASGGSIRPPPSSTTTVACN